MTVYVSMLRGVNVVGSGLNTDETPESGARIKIRATRFPKVRGDFGVTAHDDGHSGAGQKNGQCA